MSKGKWNETAPNGILEIGSRNILTDYHSITGTEIATAFTARTNTRAIQNSNAMFKCIKSSIKGSIRDTIFTQVGNHPNNTDRNSLFKKLTNFTMVASLQLSLLSFNSIIGLNPLDFKFDISLINTKLMQLFVLCTTQHRVLDDNERIQHTLNVYAKIKQPEMWAQWTRNKIDSFKDGHITNCQDFMNSAILKFKKISADDEGFKGSVHTVHDDIVAVVALKARK